MSTVKQLGEWRFPVENSFVRDSSISVEARLLYIMIQGYAGPDCELPFPSLATLSRHMDRHRKSVQNYLRELEASGHIRRTHPKIAGRFSSTRYELLDRRQVLSLRRFPPTEKVPTKSTHLKEVPIRERNTKEVKGDFDKSKVTRRASFKPKHPYPKSEEEMEHTLTSQGKEYNPDYDGDFFGQMTSSGWRIKGEPVFDWIATYEKRLHTITAV